MSIVKFENQEIELINVDGVPMMTSTQIGGALGMTHRQNVGVSKKCDVAKDVCLIYRRHLREFEPEMSRVIKHGRTHVRCFTREGAWLIGMFACTPKAAAFRKWVITTLSTVVDARPPESATDDFAVPPNLTFKTGSFSDSTIRAFYDHYIVPEGGLMPCSAVYDCFISWCARNNKFPVSKNRFGRYLHARGVQNGVMPTGGKAYFLTLRNDEDRPVDESPKPLPAPDPAQELDFDANPVAKKARFNSPARSSYGRWAYKFSPVLTFSGTGIYRMYNGDLFAVVECVNGDLNMVSFNPFLNRSEGQPTRAPAASFNDAVREKMCCRTEMM